MPYVEDQWVKIDFLDKNKKKLSSYSKICFADWKPKLPKGTEFLRYKPKHFHVTDEEGTEYVDFLKGLWHFRRTLWAHRYPTIKEKGVTINARRFNAFEFYTTVVALRYLHELPDCIKDWRYYKKFYDTPLEAFVAAHCVPINFTWNYGHSLLPRLYTGVIEGTKQEDFVKKFPTYDDKYNTLKKFADVYRVKPEPPRKKDPYEYFPKEVSLHSRS
jgi:hypothetical protein